MELLIKCFKMFARERCKKQRCWCLVEFCSNILFYFVAEYKFMCKACHEILFEKNFGARDCSSFWLKCVLLGCFSGLCLNTTTTVSTTTFIYVVQQYSLPSKFTKTTIFITT